MRMWRNGNASPCRGEDPGPIPGIRSRGALDQLAGVTVHMDWTLYGCSS